MGILLFVLIGFLVFLNREIFPDNRSRRELFLGEYDTPFNSDSKGNEYYNDRTGMKGTMYSSRMGKKYEMPEITEQPNNYKNTIFDMGIYPEEFYAGCVSDFNNDELLKTPVVVHNDPLYDYLRINKGMLVRNKCGRTIRTDTAKK